MINFKSKFEPLIYIGIYGFFAYDAYTKKSIMTFLFPFTIGLILYLIFRVRIVADENKIYISYILPICKSHTIKFNEIKHITNDRNFDIELKNGQQITFTPLFIDTIKLSNHIQKKLNQS